MNKKWFAAMLGAASMAVSAAAVAQQADSGWYAGASIGNAEAGSEDDTAWRIAGGYRFNRTFGAEAAYVNMGDFGGGDDVTSLELVGTAGFPLGNQFSIYGLAGIAMLEAGDEDETELTFGVGGQFDFSRNMGLRVQWQRYDTDPDEIDVLSVGVVFKF
jgi:opacity protein-like surface antigen